MKDTFNFYQNISVSSFITVYLNIFIVFNSPISGFPTGITPTVTTLQNSHQTTSAFPSPSFNTPSKAPIDGVKLEGVFPSASSFEART